MYIYMQLVLMQASDQIKVHKKHCTSLTYKCKLSSNEVNFSKGTFLTKVKLLRYFQVKVKQRNLKFRMQKACPTDLCKEFIDIALAY